MKIHLIAIGGAAMHNIALDLQLTHEVTGSDDEIYSPSRERLDKVGLLPSKMGWFPEKITSDIDIVILGMHAKKNNPELIKAQSLGLKIFSYPEFVFHQSKEKKRVVIAGSHGKTTTTSMIMHVLKKQKADFDYLVGANIQGFDRMVRLSNAPLIILEGDEYLSSPIDRRPKMLHYSPHISVITGIAWDHINVFPTEENYKEQFDFFISSMEEEGILFYCNLDSDLDDLVGNHPKNKLKAKGYGKYPNNQGNVSIDNEILKMAFFGSHNFQNMHAAILVLEELGYDKELSIRALQDFSGAHKRLQLLHKSNDFIAYLDFAHAPSKVKATTEAVEEQFPGYDLTVILELHTFSSLNKDFIPHYRETLARAKRAVVFYDPHTLEMKGVPELSASFVQEMFAHPNLSVLHNSHALSNELEKLGNDKQVLLVMSSGNLGGLELQKELKRLFP